MTDQMPIWVTVLVAALAPALTLLGVWLKARTDARKLELEHETAAAGRAQELAQHHGVRGEEILDAYSERIRELEGQLMSALKELRALATEIGELKGKLVKERARGDRYKRQLQALKATAESLKYKMTLDGMTSLSEPITEEIEAADEAISVAGGMPE